MVVEYIRKEINGGNVVGGAVDGLNVNGDGVELDVLTEELKLLGEVVV